MYQELLASCWAVWEWVYNHETSYYKAIYAYFWWSKEVVKTPLERLIYGIQTEYEWGGFTAPFFRVEKWRFWGKGYTKGYS